MSTKSLAAHYAKQNADLLQLVRDYYETGDERHLGSLLKALTPIFDSHLYSRFGSRLTQTMRDDLRQNALMEILKQCRSRAIVVDEGKRLAPITAWARGVCLVSALHSLTSNKAKPSQPGYDEDPFMLLTSIATPPEELTASTEDEARASELVKAATKAVLSLDLNTKNAVLMHFYHALPYEAAAQKLGIHIRVYRARVEGGLKALSSWARQQDAPSAEVYAALIRVNTGDLFRDPPPPNPNPNPNPNPKRKRDYERERETRKKAKEKAKEEAINRLII